MSDHGATAEEPWPRLRVVTDPDAPGSPRLRPPRAHDPGLPHTEAPADGTSLTEALRSAEERAQTAVETIERVRSELQLTRAAIAEAPRWTRPRRLPWSLPAAWRAALPDNATLVRRGVLALL